VSRIAAQVRDELAREIKAAGGREVSFVAEVDAKGTIVAARAVARGTVAAVLALPGVADRGEMLLHNHPSGVLEPSHSDLDVAARLHDAGIGFGIIDNTGDALYVVVEVPKATAYVTLDAMDTAAMLDRGGPIAEAMGQFEDRPSQRDMAAYVADTYNEGGVSLIEAGTGVGKSFAYLAPAILWARMNHERTVVSTNTINLQEQLVGKDLPVLAKALEGKDGPPTFALLKGWRNYLCLSRLDLARGGQGSLLEPERQQELDRLAQWSKKTTDGSRADLTDEPSPEVWDEVAAEADLCTRLRCPHFDQCFVFQARRRAADADIVVVNHHLLASDIEVRRVQSNWQDAAVLPPYKRLIIDEAHHLEDTAAQHLGAQVTSHGVSRLLARLERNGKGLIPTLIAELIDQDDLLSTASVELLRKDLMPAVVEARSHAGKVLGALGDILIGKNEAVLRLDDTFAQHEAWGQGLGVNLDNLVHALNKLRDGVETVVDRLEVDEEVDRRSQLIQELRGVVRRLQAVLDGMLLTLRPQPGAATVRWIERRGNKPVGELAFPVGLSTVPLDLAPILKEALFDRVDTVVLTSATLAVGGEFTFLKERVGLSLPPSRERFAAVLPSPFDFASQCLFGVPTDLPEPRGDEAGHDQAMARSIIELAHASDGGMFILFTSHAALRRVAQLVRATIGSRWPLLVQGEGQRDKLLRRFREAGSAILFGTDSFWEGVDVPGQALRALVIAKLPFRVPTEPLTAARLERLADQGEDGFRNYLLPLAALKLKQGFGRLIRSKTDLGVVLLMDHRVVSRNYGEVLLASLPPAARVIGPWAEVRTAAEEFFARHGIGAPA
jgi:ATP-dependent DNA helicase DinG